ncbi:MAG: hypothetical protein IJU55_06130 [Selenomonadaceae bacterium]|nr:hypothetical protein [Selenomonadaceae bacterium]
MDNKLKIGAGIGAVIIVLAGGGYFFSHSANKTTPEYAMTQVENSIKNHDKIEFYKLVDVDGVLNSSYDEVVEGLTDSDKTMSIEAREAVKNFTQMLKSPLMLSLKSAIDSYVEKGEFVGEDGVQELLSRTGIDKIEFRGFEDISVNPEKENLASADIKIFQPELGHEFMLKTNLRKDENGQWKIINLQNFREFVTQIGEVRRAQLKEYLLKAEEINSVHDKTIREAEQKYSSILAVGNIGQEGTRSDLKNLMLDVVKKDWEVRKQELFNLTVPQGAENLHNLRIKICDLEIGYAEDYAQWMSDRKAATLKSADEKHRQAQVLTTEANVLARRMAN